MVRASGSRQEVLVRRAIDRDAGAIAAIYSHYVLSTIVSFEEAAVVEPEMRRRIDEVASTGLPWLVAEHDEEVVGYAYAGRWKTRSAYRHSVESSVYVAPGVLSMGIGSRLYEVLLAELRTTRMHTVIAGIALPNQASVRLHERFGFVKCAHFTEVGFKFGRWVDVGYWQLRL